MRNKNQHITEYLEYYLGLESKPGFAVLLRGGWGAGKSWFMQDFMDQQTNQKFLRVSLYGVTSYKEIEDTFYEQLHSYLSSKAMKIGRKILAGALKTAVKIDLGKDHHGDDFSFTATLPELVNSFDKSAENRVLVFDDLERCSIKTPDIMGYINQYVETYGLKVILLANELELIKKNQEEGNENNEYLRIREKLIGKSFDIHADVGAALGVFIALTRSDGMQKLLVKHQILLIDAYETASYKNLRHLHQSVMDFDRFYDFIPADVHATEGLIEHLIKMFFALSIEIRKGVLVPEAVDKIFLIDYLTRRAGDAPTVEQKINQKYPIFGVYFHPLEPGFFSDFFKYGTLDRSAVEKCIKSSNFYTDENTKPWFKLLEFEMLEDDAFTTNVDLVWSELKDGKIDDKYVLMHVTGMMTYFSDLKLVDYTREEIFKLANENVDRLKADGKLKLLQYEQLNTKHPFNFVIYYLDDSSMLKFFSYCRQAVDEVQKDNIQIQARELLTEMKSNFPHFIEMLTLTNSSENLYYETPILAKIDPNDFVIAYMLLPNASKYWFFENLQKRYNYEEFNKKLQPEHEWWKQVVVKLADLKTEFERKVTERILDRAIGKIESFLPKLDVAEPAEPTE